MASTTPSRMIDPRYYQNPQSIPRNGASITFSFESSLNLAAAHLLSASWHASLILRPLKPNTGPWLLAVLEYMFVFNENFPKFLHNIRIVTNTCS